jgi:AcrR family transcriptional regulator
VKPSTTADLVLDAAAKIVAASVGPETLSMHALRLESGVSTGSIYHHFGSKEGVLAGLIRRSYAEWRRELGAILDRHPEDASGGVRAAVFQRLAWGQEQPGEARLVLTHRGALLADVWAVEPRAVARRFEDWLRLQAAAGRLPETDLPVALPLVFGPAEDVLRGWLDAADAPSPLTYADVLGDAAWAALQAAGAAKAG